MGQLAGQRNHAKWKHIALSLLDKYFTGEYMNYRQVFAMILPILIDQAFLVLMSFLNTAMVSSSGVAAVSAVSMVDSLNIFLVMVFIAIATGGTVIVAQYKGIENRAMVSKTAAQAISVTTLFSIIISTLVILLHVPTLNLLFGKAAADVFQNAKIYLIGSCLSYPMMALYQAVIGALRGVGETKPCLKLSFIMNLTNTGLNLVFITVFHMGITGLVLSVILARAVGMMASLIYVIKYNEEIHFKIKDALHLDFTILKKVMYIGLPFAAEQLFFNGGKLLMQTFIVQLGTLAMTAYAIGGSITTLYAIGPNTLSIAIVPIVGQSIGRRDIKDARKFTKSLMGLSSILYLLADAAFLPAFPLMVKMFHAPDKIVPTIFALVVISAISTPILWAPSFLVPTSLRAAGDSTFTSVASLLSMWLFRVVLGYILGITLGFGIVGVWFAMNAEWSVRGIIFLWRFKGEKWYSHKLV